MTSLYPESVKQIAKVIIDEIEKHFPGFMKKNFNSFGFTDEQASLALEHAEMCVYIELLKAGAFKNASL